MKLIITENQFKMLKKHINEDISNDRYERKVDVNPEYYGVTYKGKEIDSIYCNDVSLNYLIEMEGRSWGIKNISLYDIQGPEKINVTVSFYEGDDLNEIDIEIPVNWDNIDEDHSSDKGIITVGDTLTVFLKNDENGEIISDGLQIEVYSI